MPAPIRRLAATLTLVALALPAGPSRAAQDETIVMTAPFAADEVTTQCNALGGCLAEGAADKETGDLSVHVASIAGYSLGNGGDDALANARITAQHAVPAGVEAVGYHIVLDVDPALIAARPEGAQVTVSARTTHSGGAELVGGAVQLTPFTGGVIKHDGDATMEIAMDVTPEGSAAFDEGTLQVDVTLQGRVLPLQVDGASGVLAGRLESAFTLERVEATLVR